MPLYRPEQLREPGAGLGQLERVLLFSTDRDPDIAVDITAGLPSANRMACSAALRICPPVSAQRLAMSSRKTSLTPCDSGRCNSQIDRRSVASGGAKSTMTSARSADITVTEVPTP